MGWGCKNYNPDARQMKTGLSMKSPEVRGATFASSLHFLGFLSKSKHLKRKKGTKFKRKYGEEENGSLLCPFYSLPAFQSREHGRRQWQA